MSVFSSTHSATPLLGGGNSEDDHELLPLRGTDLPMVSPHEFNERSSAVAEPSIVEAIPTPTAFQAGILLLVVLMIGRAFRKLRLA